MSSDLGWIVGTMTQLIYMLWQSQNKAFPANERRRRFCAKDAYSMRIDREVFVRTFHKKEVQELLVDFGIRKEGRLHIYDAMDGGGSGKVELGNIIDSVWELGVHAAR